MLATTLNVELTPIFPGTRKKKLSNFQKIVRTMNITQSSVGDKRGLWTTVLAAAILLEGDLSFRRYSDFVEPASCRLFLFSQSKQPADAGATESGAQLP